MTTLCAILQPYAKLQRPSGCKEMLSATMCFASNGMMADKTVAIRVQMPNTLQAKFKAQCALKDKSMNEVVVELGEEWLSEREDPAL